MKTRLAVAAATVVVVLMLFSLSVRPLNAGWLWGNENKTEAEKLIPCPACGGAGKVERRGDGVGIGPHGKPDWVIGAGPYKTETCGVCNGTGQIKYPPERKN
jgi:hypothetical protein